MPDRDKFRRLPGGWQRAARSFAALARGKASELDQEAVAQGFIRDLAGGVQTLEATLRVFGEFNRQRADACQHCGTCTSCLFWRAALFAAIGTHDPTDYLLSLAKIDDLYELDAFSDQAEMFLAWSTISDALAYSPHLRWGLTYARQSTAFSRNIDDELVALFNRHGSEVAAMLSGHARSMPRRKRNAQEAPHALS